MNRILRTLLTGLTLIVGGSIVRAGPFEDASDAYQRGDYATALRLSRPLADQGLAEAQTYLGLMYEKGLGVPKDYQQAAAWFRKAADQGYAIAQNNLGEMYANGALGLPPSDIAGPVRAN
jgi:uncharacterized protein